MLAETFIGIAFDKVVDDKPEYNIEENVGKVTAEDPGDSVF